MTGGRTRVVFKETLWRYLSGLIPRVELPSDHSHSSMRPIPIPSENSPCRGLQRTTLARSPLETEELRMILSLPAVFVDFEVLQNLRFL
jgi:hypothetical protein